MPLPPQLFPQPSVSKNKLEKDVFFDDGKKLNKSYESRFRHLESRTKKLELKLKETDQQLKTLKKCMKTILKSNQKLESIYKDTFKDLKKSI